MQKVNKNNQGEQVFTSSPFSTFAAVARANGADGLEACAQASLLARAFAEGMANVLRDEVARALEGAV